MTPKQAYALLQAVKIQTKYTPSDWECYILDSIKDKLNKSLVLTDKQVLMLQRIYKKARVRITV